MKTEVIPFKKFVSGDWKEKSEVMTVSKVLAASGTIALVMLPKITLAAGTNATFANLHGAVMNGFDAGVVLVIIFAGAAWALGHRGKAMEILIGVCCGYLLARHAVDIRDFLRGI